MKVVPWPLDAEARAALQGAVDRGNTDWREIEGWLADCVACIWKIGATGFVLTFANAADEIEVVLAGGSGAKSCVGPWEAKMRALPAHKGKVLVLEGRRGWARLLPHWDVQGRPGGQVKMRTVVA